MDLWMDGFLTDLLGGRCYNTTLSLRISGRRGRVEDRRVNVLVHVCERTWGGLLRDGHDFGSRVTEAEMLYLLCIH